MSHFLGAVLLLQPAEIPLPCPAERLFGRQAPLGVDLGCGDGRFLARMAEARPDWNWLGVEVSAHYALRTLVKLHRQRAMNARLLHGTAWFAFRHLLGPDSVTELYVNFPDPWPKSRHQSRRLLQAPFLRLVASRLVPGGQLYVTTDHLEYLAFVAAEAEALGCYQAWSGPPPPPVLETKYAAKWRAAARPIAHLRLTLAREIEDVYPPLTRYPMPHAFLRGHLPDVAQFSKQVRHLDEGQVILLEVWCSPKGDGLLFLAQVSEEGLAQSVLIEARSHRQGVLVRLRPFGQPLITASVRAAVGAVSEWLAAQGMTIERRAY